jgi:NNP family nitrate/nitrite transporter-like MFS transporter
MKALEINGDGRAREEVQLVLATGGFFVCFAIFGSVAGMMPFTAERLGLTNAQVGFALAVPVLLGAAGRIPLGMLTDRIGGRAVYIGVMAFSIVPALLMGLANRYWQVLVCGFLLGVPLAVFPVGVAFISNWYPSRRHGGALGFMTFGSIGHSLALCGAPLAVGWFGYCWGFWSFALLLFGWLTVFTGLARNAPARTAPKKLSELVRPLHRPMSWMFSFFYFLTLGSFLTLSAFLPRFLTLQFGLSKTDAGLRAAGFVTLATLARPIGGMLADRIGGRRVLLNSLPAVVLASLLMAGPHLLTFTIGVLSLAIAIGFSSGALFQLVPQHFPDAVGSVTGLVGAAGGMGGFFPPIALGLIYQLTGSFALGFNLLSLVALCCFGLCLRSLPATPSTNDKRHLVLIDPV